MVTTAVMFLLNPACGAGDMDGSVFHGVLGAILALWISLSSIVLATGSGVVDGAV